MFDAWAPRDLLEWSLRGLIDGASPELQQDLRGFGKIEVVVADRTGFKTGFDAFSERATRRRLVILQRHGYAITVHRTLIPFLTDLSDLLRARSEVISSSGEVRAPADLTHEEASSALGDAIASYVRSERWDMSSALIRAAYIEGMRRRENPDEPVKSTFLLWTDMALFLVAHELAHILLGHCDGPIPSTEADRWQAELESDETAAVLVAHSVYHRVGVSRTELTEMDRAKVQVSINQTMIAIAVLFEVLYLLAEFARRDGTNWMKGHPPGDLRYQRFRQYHVQQLGYPEEVFSRGSGLGAPDETRLLFRDLAASILS